VEQKNRDQTSGKISFLTVMTV